MKRRALLVGINNYENVPPLQCCVDDAMALDELLAENDDGSPNYSCRLMTSDSDKVTEKDLREAVTELLLDFRGGDVLFYFSGHGVAADEGEGARLLAQESSTEGGYPMSELLQAANESEVESVLLILDCCHSGSIGNGAGDKDYNQVTLSEGVTILAASTAKQRSQEGVENSLFTELLMDALRGGAADVLGRVSAASVYAYVEQALGVWQQRPMYKSHARELAPVRICEPAVPRKELRKMVKVFKAPFLRIKMDPSFEHTVADATPEHVAQFNLFKLLRNARLLNTTDGKDLYYAALESGSVELTPLGRFYWQQVVNKRV